MDGQRRNRLSVAAACALIGAAGCWAIGEGTSGGEEAQIQQATSGPASQPANQAEPATQQGATQPEPATQTVQVTPPEPAATKPKVPPRRARKSTDPLTDQDVLEAMQRGIDFLLKDKQGDNWELRNNFPNEEGGPTAIAVYGLLHAGRSPGMDDPRLMPRSEELAPAIKYLTTLVPNATYVSGLSASALTLCPRSPEGDAALRNLQNYITDAMGTDGGYTYVHWDKNLGELDQKIALVRIQIAAAKKKGAPEAQMRNALQQLQTLEQQRLMMLKNQAPSAVDLGTQLQNQVISAKARVEQLRAQGAPADQIKSAEEAVKRQMEALQSARDRGALKLRPLGDLSNGQYGTLGAWALADGGIEMPNAYWKTADRFWRLTQMQDGGWTYPAGRWEWPGSKMSMTLAGVASLYVTGEFTDTELRLTNRPDPAVERALERISREFKANLELYEMYGVERVGLATGLKFFNETNWYEAGAKALLQTQGGDGSWNYRDTVPGTAYALLFLARGRNPVVFNKLEYPGNTWNARPRDNANLTRWMARRFEREINWQVVNLKVQPEEWLDAPILMITGSVDPKFTPQDIAKLRSFVEAGGLIFSTADGDNPEFTKAVRRIAGQLVDGKYELRELPATHPVFNIHTPMKSGEVVNYAPVKMMGLSNGVRELWVHSPTDMGAAWQGRKVAKKECFEVPANLFFYATGKGTLRSKLQPLAVMPSKEKPVRQVTLARVMYNGNWDPEPGAWRRLSKVAQSEFATDLQTKAVEMEKLDAKQTPLAHLTGTVRFSPSAAEVEGLQAFLKAGGTLFVDVMGGGGGGNDAFATSFAELMKQVDPEAKLTLLGEDDPLYKGAFAGGKDCTSVEYRRFSIETYGRRTKPALQAYMIGGRQAVIYSAADVTSGLLGTNTWGILGYAPNSAEDLARNVVLRFGVAAPAAK